MRIVLTNDDGYDAEGIRAAYGALVSLGSVHVVAPLHERSACSHAITLRRPIIAQHCTDGPYESCHIVDGSPADCIRLAVAELFATPTAEPEDGRKTASDRDIPSRPRIDLVVSGINRGANAGVDTFYSGTVAAAREAAILGLPAIAVSQAIRNDVETDWDVTANVAGELIRMLIDESLPGPGFWSINLPAPIPDDALKHVQRVPVASHPMPMRFEKTACDDGRTAYTYGASYWQRETQGPSDYNAISNGHIAVSAIPLFGKF